MNDDTSQLMKSIEYLVLVGGFNETVAGLFHECCVGFNKLPASKESVTIAELISEVDLVGLESVSRAYITHQDEYIKQDYLDKAEYTMEQIEDILNRIDDYGGISG